MLGSASSSSMKRLPQGRHQASAGTADSPVDTARKPRSMSSAPLSLGGGQGTPPRLDQAIDQAASQATPREVLHFRRLS